MTEIKQRKVQAEDLNNRIQDAIIVRKTRMRTEPKKKKEANEPEVDKEQQLRDLLQEAKDLKLQSDQITKLNQKIIDIDKWKQEVQALFSNQEEELADYKRYRDHYKCLVARSSAFHIELKLMKELQKKCSFIDWRDKVEDIAEKQEKMTLDQIQQILEEGKEKGFLSEAVDHKFTFHCDEF